MYVCMSDGSRWVMADGRMSDGQMADVCVYDDDVCPYVCAYVCGCVVSVCVCDDIVCSVKMHPVR